MHLVQSAVTEFESAIKFILLFKIRHANCVLLLYNLLWAFQSFGFLQLRKMLMGFHVVSRNVLRSARKPETGHI